MSLPSSPSPSDSDGDFEENVNEKYSTKTYRVYGEAYPYKVDNTELENVLTFGGIFCEKEGWNEMLTPGEYVRDKNDCVARVLTHTRYTKIPTNDKTKWKTANSKGMFGTLVATKSMVLLWKTGGITPSEKPSPDDTLQVP